MDEKNIKNEYYADILHNVKWLLKQQKKEICEQNLMIVLLQIGMDLGLQSAVEDPTLQHFNALVADYNNDLIDKKEVKNDL